ncbi:MAG: thioesterase [Frankiales bacterium]|jgi:1,4-dihydroxy-2-naphthoyl-CoA hydrolase|nr:thioesterase [Frankiales bacterium]
MSDTTGLPVSGFDSLIGLRFDEVTKDQVVASFDITPQLQQPYGILHGGVLCSVVETVGSVSGANWSGGAVVGTSNHTNFIKASREGRLTATSKPIHRGRTQQLWEVTITDEQDRLIAIGQLRLANLDNTDLGKS